MRTFCGAGVCCMSLHTDRPYLADMRDTARKVLRFTEGVDHERFLANEEMQWVVIRGIEVIGEASTKVSPERTPTCHGPRCAACGTS